MEARPKSKIPNSTPEKLANIVGYSIFVGSLVYVILAFTSLSDNILMHNYPIRMNKSNVEAFYLNSRQIVNFSENGVMFIFAFIFIEITSYGLNGEASFGIFLLPFILVISLGPVVWKLNQCRKIK